MPETPPHAAAPTRVGANRRTWGRGAAVVGTPEHEVLIACVDCKRKAGGSGKLRAVKLWSVRPITRPAYTAGRGLGAPRVEQSWNLAVARCADSEECRLYRKEKLEKARLRSGTLQWAESRFLHIAKKGECRWCGEPIVLVDPTDRRRAQRRYHRGDEHEVGDQQCRQAHNRCFANDGRALIQLRGDPACVDCGDEGWDWDAEHDVPIWKGGAHCVTNILRRCASCHKKKTKREARERADLRRQAA